MVGFNAFLVYPVSGAPTAAWRWFFFSGSTRQSLEEPGYDYHLLLIAELSLNYLLQKEEDL